MKPQFAPFLLITILFPLFEGRGQGAAKAESPPPEKSGFNTQQSRIKGLLVMELGVGNFMGKASQMNCTAVKASVPVLPTRVKFNQNVGDDMTKALVEVVKHSTVKQGELPAGYVIDFAFEDKYTAKDGPSAAVACALMLNSLRTGKEIDVNFAVTGDMNADGTVQTVGGVPDKIRGAANMHCTYVAVPMATEGDLEDMVILDGPKGLWEIQVFGIKTLDDALALSATRKSPVLEEALKNFADVRRVLMGSPALLANPKVLERLATIGKAAPNCTSARILYNYGTNRMKKNLSLRGSLNQIDKVSFELLKNMKAPKPSGVETDVLAKSLSEMSRLRSKLDPRTIAYTDSILTYGNEIRNIKSKPPNGENEAGKALQKIRVAVNRVRTEEDKILSNKNWMEEVAK